jgi:hypothetical protein
MKPKEKRALLARFIEQSVKDGIDISDFLCRPLNYFDYDKITKAIENAD